MLNKQPFIISHKSVAQLSGSLMCPVLDDFGYTHLCMHLCLAVGGRRLHGLGWTWLVCASSVLQGPLPSRLAYTCPPDSGTRRASAHDLWRPGLGTDQGCSQHRLIKKIGQIQGDSGLHCLRRGSEGLHGHTVRGVEKRGVENRDRVSVSLPPL